MTASSSPAAILDTAIVGAGVSGLYSAWRLLSEGNAGRVTVFEGGNRVGGRLLSVTPPGMDDTRCELGGMRYMSRHVLVAELVKRFEMPTAPMPVDEPQNIAYLRGRRLRQADLTVPEKIPYNLTDAEKSQLGGSLLMAALTQIVPNCETLAGLDFSTLQTEMQTATFDGVPLHRQGFWNVLARVLSPDAYTFVRDSCGYDCLVSNWSAADAIPFILADFGSDVTYSRFPHGYDRLPQRLASEVERLGGEVRLWHCLKGFDTVTAADGSRCVQLDFVDGASVLARRLVLAMPRRSLELLEARGAVLDPQHHAVRQLIESVEPIPLFKIFVCYPYPWWKAAGVSTGRTLTDLPIRQCYYWAVQKADANTDGHSALLASYDDDLSVNFWAGLRSRFSENRTVWPPARHEHAGGEDWVDYKAPPAMLKEVHRQLVQLHGLSYAPKPYAAAYRDWAEDPYGGGVNFWKIHAKSWEVIPAIIQPVAGVPVFICGEAYSHEQGWVEGALQTAELMVTGHFGLQPLLPSTAASTATSVATSAAAAAAARSS